MKGYPICCINFAEGPWPVLSSLRGRGAPPGNLLMAVCRVRRRSVLGLAANKDQPQQKTESENGGKTTPKSMCDFMIIHHFPH